MYIVSWYDSEFLQLMASDTKSLFALISILESKKIKYKVSDRMGLTEPKYFGWGDFDYWIKNESEHLYGE